MFVEVGDLIEDRLRGAVRRRLAAVGVFDGEVPSLRVDVREVHAPALRGIGKRLLFVNKVNQVIIVQRVGLAEVAAGVELVVPGLARLRALLEEEHHGLDARALERAAGAVEDGVQVAALQQHLPEADGGVVGVREERVLDDDARAAAGLEHLDEVLEEEERRLAGADREVLLDLLALLAAEGRVGEDDVEAVLLLDVGEVLREGVGVADVRRLDAVQDHVHDRDHVGEGLLLLAVECRLLQALDVGGRELAALLEVDERLAEEARGADGAVVDALADARVDDLDDGADERAGRVVLAAVAPGVAHVLDLGLVEVGELVLFVLGPELEAVDEVDDLAQVVAALDLVLDLREDLADLVLQRLGVVGLLGEPAQVGEELVVDEGDQVRAVHRGLVVEPAVAALGGGPGVPAVGLVEDVRVGAAGQRGLGGFVLFKPVEVFEEEEPGGLLRVVEFRGAPGLLAEGVVEILENLLEHDSCFPSS